MAFSILCELYQFLTFPLGLFWPCFNNSWTGWTVKDPHNSCAYLDDIFMVTDGSTQHLQAILRYLRWQLSCSAWRGGVVDGSTPFPSVTPRMAPYSRWYLTMKWVVFTFYYRTTSCCMILPCPILLVLSQWILSTTTQNYLWKNTCSGFYGTDVACIQYRQLL